MVSLSTISKATVCRFSYINATTFYPLNYWVNLSGNVSDFHNSHVQLHSGKFPPCALSYMPRQYRWESGKSSRWCQCTIHGCQPTNRKQPPNKIINTLRTLNPIDNGAITSILLLISDSNCPSLSFLF